MTAIAHPRFTPRLDWGVEGVRGMGYMGDTSNSSLAIQATQTAGAAAGIAAAIAGASSVIPIIGPVVGGVTLLISLFSKLFSGCGQTCIETTQIVNQIEDGPLQPPLIPLKQALAMFQAGQLSQCDALANFDAAWAAVKNACGNPQFGDAGVRCISDRQPGGKWDWFALYRNPVANATQEQIQAAKNAPPVQGSTCAGAIISGVGEAVSSIPIWGWIALGVGVLVLTSD